MKEFSKKIIKEIKKQIPADQKVEFSSIMKNNGITEEAICIVEKNKNISPTIYLKEFYDWYKDGVNPEEIAAEIIRRNNEYKLKESLDIGFFVDYEKAKSRIVFKLINRKMNQTLLEKIPYINYMDLAMVFYYFVHDEETGNATILIHNSHLNMWEVTVEEVYKQARANTPVLLPAAIT